MGKPLSMRFDAQRIILHDFFKKKMLAYAIAISFNFYANFVIKKKHFETLFFLNNNLI